MEERADSVRVEGELVRGGMEAAVQPEQEHAALEAGEPDVRVLGDLPCGCRDPGDAPLGRQAVLSSLGVSCREFATIDGGLDEGSLRLREGDTGPDVEFLRDRGDGGEVGGLADDTHDIGRLS